MTDPARTQPVWISETPLGKARAVAYAAAPTKLDDARAEVAHYADLNRVLGEALARATDTAKNAVAQEQALQEEVEELRRDTAEVWGRAIRAVELERQLHAAQAELNAARGIVAQARGIR